ncbi:glycosyl hydrolase family 47 [Ancylostoma ceylanicum]|uniref:alpha-1,2-Mannosidase n=1 Tax=Ancylostoma ceylanicum TaxID=53326 RepID=A0A0D6LLB8_9BILA|nr:glycosyl hydrolase family 47 [Ancylostoma ceylanicum]
MNERYVVLIGIFFLATVSFLSLFLLPSTGPDELISHEHIVPHVRDIEVRKNLQAQEAAELRRKAEEAGIIPPPIPKPEVAAADDSEARRVTVKQMTKFAWDNYRKYAWGSNELRPVSKKGHSASVFGAGDIGATIVDAIDTLWIMGLKEEYEQARSWIQHSLDFSRAAMYVEKAESIAKLLLPAFDTPTGIPYALVNPTTGSTKNYGWASGGCSILSEFGSLQLEFDYLSHVSGNKIYSEKVQKIRNFLTQMEKPKGLYPLYLNPRTGKWGSPYNVKKEVFCCNFCKDRIIFIVDHSIGALGDSFYEYLLKHWLITGKKDELTKNEYDAAVFAMEKKMLFESQQQKLWYFANLRGSRVEHKMEHLACFSGGMFALHSANEDNSTAAVVETWFYLWRITKQDKYREWAWNVVLALEKHAKVEAGYSGIRDVYSVPVEYDDVQQSFIFAELFKYLYLIFSDDNVLPLDRWVFNTEAHPFPVRS